MIKNIKEDVDLKKVYEFSATISYPIYYNDKTNWGIYEFVTEEKIPFTNEYFTNNKTYYQGCLCGSMQELSRDIEYKIKAKLKYNSKYKKYDYNIENIGWQKPTSQEGQANFLRILVTENQANALLEVYPNIVEDIMKGIDIDYTNIKGIGDKTFEKIKEKVIDNYVIQDILVLLKPLGVTFNAIKKMLNYEENPSLLKQRIIENPYMLTSVHGLGFKKVDVIALKLNPKLKVSKERVKAYIFYILNNIANSEGSTWVTKKDLIGYVRNDIRECIDLYKELVEEETLSPKFLYVDDKRVGLLKFYKKAKEIKEQLDYLNSLESIFEPFTEEEMDNSIKETEKSLGFLFTDEQVKAIKSVNENNVILVTAPAGAGKTSAIKGMYDLLSKGKIKKKLDIEDNQKINNNETELFGDMRTITIPISIGQCALSAKAAKRMKEMTGRSAITMHRMLEFNGDGFARNKEMPLNYHVNIWDEASMVNKSLVSSYLNAIKPHSKVIIIFDFAQLPPIGSGDFTRDVLKSKELCINLFTKVHRQGEKSGILMDANKIRQGINPIEKIESKIVHGELQDLFYFFGTNKENMRDLAIKSYLKSAEDVGLDDVVIITPRKKDCVNSALEINKIIQDKLIPDGVPSMKRFKDGKDCIFKLGAKVIQRKNDSQKAIYNGDEGYISEIKGGMFKVTFSTESGKRDVMYYLNEIEQIELSYAISVHLSQGSQYNSVICVFDKSSYIMLNRKILYTALTRAKDKCMLITEPNVFKACLNNKNNQPRNTFLSEMF